jgi:uncharacterized protein YlzI (FlbEa/FlbD family)
MDNVNSVQELVEKIQGYFPTFTELQSIIDKIADFMKKIAQIFEDIIDGLKSNFKPFDDPFETTGA